MKGFAFFVAVLALTVAIRADDDDELHEFVPKDMGCVWSVKVDVKTLFRHNIYTLYVNDWFMRRTVENDDGVLVSDTVFRPDVTFTVGEDSENSGIEFFNLFMYDGTSCENQSYILEAYSEDPVDFVLKMGDKYTNLPGGFPLRYLFLGGNFTNKDKKERINEDDDEKYTCYYNNVTGGPDKDTLALYVDKDKQLVAYVAYNDKPGERIEARLEWSKKAYLKDFMFKEKLIFNCSDNHILEEPKARKGSKCAASATQAALAVVIVSVVSALISLF